MTTVAARTSGKSGSATTVDGKAARSTPTSTTNRSAQAAASGRNDLSRVEDFLQALARAVRQFHTYPATSPRCIEAVDEAHRALALIDLDSVACVVSPRELLISGTALGRDTLIEHELARRLYEARYQTLDIDRVSTRRDLARLCADLVAREGSDGSSLADRLRNHGVERIQVSAAYRPEFLDIAAPVTACASAEAHRQREEAQPVAGRVAHLYPADKGWVRLDPGVSLPQVTLSGLAVLVEDPASLAQMLSKLVANPPDEPLSPADALEERCEDVARLYSSLDPAVARARFARLASAVLILEPTQRRRLLSNTVLPAFVDGRPEGELLRDFPDVDLAEALSLFLDVETAAPELLTTALDRLNLSPERRDAVGPLLEQRIRAKTNEAAAQRHSDAALQERTQQLIRVVTRDATFEGFAAFDLCIDDATEELIAGTGAAIGATNLPDVQLTCVCQLIAINPNPEVVERLLRPATRLLGELERTKSWGELVRGLDGLRRTAASLQESRPDVATVIATAMDTFYTPARFERLLTMYDSEGDDRTIAQQLVTAAGPSLTAAVVRGLQDAPNDKRILQLVCDHAVTFAGALTKALDEFGVPQRVAAIRAFAAAGRGFEPQIARQLTHQSDAVVREALRALARIGSDDAAESVTRYLLRGGATATSAAEEALLHFSPTATCHCVRSLLRQRQFVLANPEMTLRLLERTDRFDASKLADVLAPLASLRFRFWNRRLARIGQRAAALVRS